MESGGLAETDWVFIPIIQATDDGWSRMVVGIYRKNAQIQEIVEGGGYKIVCTYQ